jgi:two-component system sensor histidine kinase PilS (NtrC family)
MESRKQPAGSDLFARLKWSLFFRLIIVSIIMVSVIVFQLRENLTFFVPNLIAFYVVVAISYFITLISLLLINRIKKLALVCWAQVAWEVIFASTLIYLTGIWDSLFSFLYVLAIIISSILLFRTGAFFSATACSLLYGAEMFGVKYGWVPSLFPIGPEPDLINLIRNFFLNFVGFYASALVASYITEQLRQTGEELSEARLGIDRLEALNEAIVHSIDTGLVTLDQKGRIIFLNSSAEKIFARNSGELIGKTLREILPAPFYEKLNANKSGRVKLAFSNPAGKEVILECFWQKLQNPEKLPAGELLAIADITDLDKMEERLKVADRLAAVGKLAAGIAHEVRNPLGAISGSIELLKKEIEPGSQDAHLMDIVLNETDRLNKLITDFLLYARPAPRSIQAIQVDRLFANLGEMVRAKSSRVELVLEMEPDMIIYSDPRLIEQIFWNLVNNALESIADEGKLVIKGKAEIRNYTPGIWMSFSDTGVGIPLENMNKIFDPFFTTKDNGTGLGLSTIWRIVEELNGEIGVQSRPGRGANFEIWLPTEPARKKESASG